MTISPISAEPTISARRCAASNGSAVQPSGPARPRGERAASGELADLAGELADAERGDRRLVVEPVAPDDLDRALEHQPGRRVPLADVVDALAGREALARRRWRSACAVSICAGVEHRETSGDRGYRSGLMTSPDGPSRRGHFSMWVKGARVPDAVQRARLFLGARGAPLIRDRPSSGVCNVPWSAAHRHSASKTRVNALMDALRCARDTQRQRLRQLARRTISVLCEPPHTARAPDRLIIVREASQKGRALRSAKRAE